MSHDPHKFGKLQKFENSLKNILIEISVIID